LSGVSIWNCDSDDAPKPITVILVSPSVEDVAPHPTNTELFIVSSFGLVFTPASKPTATLPKPVVLSSKALVPSPTFWLPVVVLNSDCVPNAALSLAVVLALSACAPTPTLKEPLLAAQNLPVHPTHFATLEIEGQDPTEISQI
jgi:hypothetical protein